MHDLYRGLLVATTHGTIVARLSFPYSQLINRLKDVELLLRDEAQQLGTPGSNTILAHIKHALDVITISMSYMGLLTMYFPCEDFLWWDVLFCPEALQSCLMSCADAAVLVSIKSFHGSGALVIQPLGPRIHLCSGRQDPYLPGSGPKPH